MKIGEAAAASGCHIETIRYYERIGLLPRPARTGGGYRDYHEDDLRRLRFTTRGRELGFSLDEIRSLLQLSDDPKLSCAEVDHMARHHLAEIQQRISELRRMADELQRTVAACGGGERARCVILNTLWRERPNAGKANSPRAMVP
ncbi:MerR family transcriptional regulator [Ahniella affigens]|uniref:MerR family transcriptional regulator n=1 Tax=Ahniella affigens TaxID=2021234 RepID=A0A2P1PQX3_9GAMM|nr:helix-turn-helix domain-containing protein [Ahniella affigens]AVP97247.1 MerR family transcriptional regulator [Ahniella affigens]